MNHCANCLSRKRCKDRETKQWCDRYADDWEAMRFQFKILTTEPIDYKKLYAV